MVCTLDSSSLKKKIFKHIIWNGCTSEEDDDDVNIVQGFSVKQVRGADHPKQKKTTQSPQRRDVQSMISLTLLD